MDDSLQWILNKLKTADDAALLNSLDVNTSALRVQLSVSQLLNKIYSAQLSSDQFVSLIYVMLKSASVEWLVPELGQANQERPHTTAASGVADGTSECTYSVLSTALCKQACMRSLANEEETCQDLSKKLGEKAGIACTAMRTFSHLLSSLSSHATCGQPSCKRTVQRVIRTLSCGAVVVCLEHGHGCRWTTAQSFECAESLLSDVCSAHGCDTLESLLNANDGKFGLLQHVLGDVLLKLTRSTWKLNPAAAHAFRRCLLATRQPLLGDSLPMFLPPTLLFVDDFEAENRLLGLGCLRHILQQSSRTELRWYGRADVIYDSLVRALFRCDDVSLDAVILCMFDVLNVVEASPRSATGSRPWGRHDDVFAKYLTDMEMESKIPLRRVYARHLGSLVSKLGITVVRHLSRLMHVVTDYLQVTIHVQTFSASLGRLSTEST